ncbi:histidine phosphatase family protein [Paludisphaera rhizosphaerae]|uniref:histidine phosphatase family protein n=1 Tax=Paludisphaera rhizosphaerae TaxID=2711216 RepID=UPI001F0EC215|nr:histidine phosphatase family protein [Paludisphaera rhizosphaerae]
MAALMSSQVLLIRPGATLYDEQNRVQGVLDIPLSEQGRSEVDRLAERLAARGDAPRLAALYCGPGESVVRTAEIVGKALGLRPKRIDEFRNLDQGLWQGLQIEEIRRRNTRLFRQWIDDPRTIRPPQGETIEEAMERVRAAFRPLFRRHQSEAFGLVAGEPLGRLIAAYLKRVPRLQLDEFLPCCGFERIEVHADVLGGNGSS